MVQLSIIYRLSSWKTKNDDLYINAERQHEREILDRLQPSLVHENIT